MKNIKTYDGELMKKGTVNEQKIINWLKKLNYNVDDLRYNTEQQRKDIDFRVWNSSRNFTLEAKSDIYIQEDKNFLFENQRINHYQVKNWNYQGWGWRSEQDFLIVRNPKTNEQYIFNFLRLRTFMGEYIQDQGKKIKISIVETDEQKTTFNFLIPMEKMKNLYKKVYII